MIQGLVTSKKNLLITPMININFAERLKQANLVTKKILIINFQVLLGKLY